LAVACALPAGSAQAASAGQHDNVATADNEVDATQVADFAWGVSRQRGGDVVDQLNAARATSRCTDCGATAVAFQIVLVSGSPTKVVPRNEAVAINQVCTRCETAAEARQFVRVVDQRVRFTGRGQRELAREVGAQPEIDLIAASRGAKAAGAPARCVHVHNGLNVTSAHGLASWCGRPGEARRV